MWLNGQRGVIVENRYGKARSAEEESAMEAKIEALKAQEKALLKQTSEVATREAVLYRQQEQVRGVADALRKKEVILNNMTTTWANKEKSFGLRETALTKAEEKERRIQEFYHTRFANVASSERALAEKEKEAARKMAQAQKALEVKREEAATEIAQQEKALKAKEKEAADELAKRTQALQSAKDQVAADAASREEQWAKKIRKFHLQLKAQAAEVNARVESKKHAEEMRLKSWADHQREWLAGRMEDVNAKESAVMGREIAVKKEEIRASNFERDVQKYSSAMRTQSESINQRGLQIEKDLVGRENRLVKFASSLESRSAKVAEQEKLLQSNEQKIEQQTKILNARMDEMKRWENALHTWEQHLEAQGTDMKHFGKSAMKPRPPSPDTVKKRLRGAVDELVRGDTLELDPDRIWAQSS